MSPLEYLQGVRQWRPAAPLPIGATLGTYIEPSVRYARLVARRKGVVRPLERCVIRLFREGDGDFPTGEYRTVSEVFMVPWRRP